MPKINDVVLEVEKPENSVHPSGDSTLDAVMVLYVSADQNDVTLVRHAFETAAPGLVLEDTDTIEKALQRLRNPASYDAVLVDYRLPDGDGSSVVTHIRKRALRYPVLVMASPQQKVMADHTIRDAADACILKQQPDLVRLPAVLRGALDRRAGRIGGTHPVRVVWVGELARVREQLAERAPHVHLAAHSSDSLGLAQLLATLRTATAHTFNLLVLDSTTGDLNPVYVLREVRSAGFDIPIVVLTQPEDDELPERVVDAGAANCIPRTDGYVDRLLPIFEAAISHDQLAETSLALRSASSRLRAIIESQPVCLSEIAPDGRLLAMNVANLALVGAERLADVAGRDFRCLVDSTDRQRAGEFIQRVCEGHSGSLEYSLVRFDGAVIAVTSDAVPLSRDPGGTASALLVTRDVTDQKTPKQASPETEGTTRQTGDGVTTDDDRMLRALKAAETRYARLAAVHEAERTRLEQALHAAEAAQGEAERQHATERESLERARHEFKAQLQDAATQQTTAHGSLTQRLQQAEDRYEQLSAERTGERAGLEAAVKAAEERHTQTAADHAAERERLEQSLQQAWRDLEQDREAHTVQVQVQEHARARSEAEAQVTQVKEQAASERTVVDAAVQAAEERVRQTAAERERLEQSLQQVDRASGVKNSSDWRVRDPTMEPV